ncbi:hypothetical protein [uncultured Cytophaga sp.]|uniref:hypothetical protein n=1 Tax=uncultured Cytophaga sp. TaxID=160238 RepID=UPI002614143A|nr:hypothetical protein [uncultured Cytophaga sp.]
MIKISPLNSELSECPSCKSHKTTTKKILFPGIHVVADSVCNACNLEFIQDLPVGHGCYYPVSINKNTEDVFDHFSIDWFTQNFIKSYFNKQKIDVSIERIIKKNQEDVIIINCLDYLYGHVLLKLFNVQFYKEKHPDLGLIVIVPKNYLWLVPRFVDEIWIVDLKLNQLKKWYTSLSDSINSYLTEYKTIQLAYNFPHPYTENIQIENFTQVEPFALDKFESQSLNITYIYRTDRLWHRNKMEYFFYLAFKKLNLLRLVEWVFMYVQNRNIGKTEAILRKSFPDLVFNVVGLGKKGNFKGRIIDKRVDLPTIDIEIEWCKTYAASHVVVGIHGSNMLLPTGLAAAFVELLPIDRTGNLTQDVITRYTGRIALFMGRFISDKSSAHLVANQVKAIYTGWPLFDLYTSPSNHSYDLDENQTFLNVLRSRVRLLFKS